MSFDFSLIWNSLPLLLAGAGVTIEITAIAVGLGFIFGLITSVCRLSGVKILQVIAVCYVNIIRGTPMLVQIFLIYFALPMVIGERINPTGKKKLQAELRAGKLDMVRAMAREQERNGASILDVNMGTNGIDEKEMMLKAIYEVTGVSGLPLSIDTSSPDIMEAALRIYPGRALVNSISCETEKRKKLLPVVKKYGAMFIALPVSDNGIPKTLEEKHAVLDELLADAYDHGFSPEDVVVDALVATVGAAPTSALDCMATFSAVRRS